MRQNFPDTDLAAWDIIESFGPTPSGAQGFTVQIPEMDKVGAGLCWHCSLQECIYVC